MESKRIKKLRTDLIKEIPFFPNNKATKEKLEKKNLSQLLVDFLNWKSRLIPTRKRTVKINRILNRADSKVKSILKSQDFISLKSKIENGEDICDYLSLKAHYEGYSPDSENGNWWLDKDFILNVMNFYHFHLIPYDKNSHITTRSNHLIFAKVERELFEIIGIFDHLVFEDLNEKERKKLWSTREKIITQNIPKGSAVISTSITTTGHQSSLVRAAIKYAKIIQNTDTQLDDYNYLKALYENNEIPKRPNLKWAFYGTDLGLLDKNNKFFILHKGQN